MHANICYVVWDISTESPLGKKKNAFYETQFTLFFGETF